MALGETSNGLVIGSVSSMPSFSSHEIFQHVLANDCDLQTRAGNQSKQRMPDQCLSKLRVAQDSRSKLKCSRETGLAGPSRLRVATCSP